MIIISPLTIEPVVAESSTPIISSKCDPLALIVTFPPAIADSAPTIPGGSLSGVPSLSQPQTFSYVSTVTFPPTWNRLPVKFIFSPAPIMSQFAPIRTIRSVPAYAESPAIICISPSTIACVGSSRIPSIPVA